MPALRILFRGNLEQPHKQQSILRCELQLRNELWTHAKALSVVKDIDAHTSCISDNNIFANNE